MLGGHILQLSIAKYLFSSWTNWNKHPHAVSFSESFNKHWIIVLHLSWRTIALNSPGRENVSTLFSVELGKGSWWKTWMPGWSYPPSPTLRKNPTFFLDDIRWFFFLSIWNKDICCQDALISKFYTTVFVPFSACSQLPFSHPPTFRTWDKWGEGKGPDTHWVPMCAAHMFDVYPLF